MSSSSIRIVCIGWGSLVWCRKALPVRGPWHADGPKLPVEFARESLDGRITLVLCDGALAVTTLWAELESSSLEAAKALLAVREGIPRKFISNLIGFWSPETQSNGLGSDFVAEWARTKGFEGVVWTALQPKFAKQDRIPSQDEVVCYLSSLRETRRQTAEEYVRLAPRQIATCYRLAIEQALGWTPNGLV